MPDAKKTETKSAPYKALMFCKDIHDANQYDHDVFVHNTVDGVYRMNFGTYLRTISEPHEGAYRLEKVYPEKLKDNGTTQADAQYLINKVRGEGYNTEGKSDRVYMAFRSVWAAVTGELMSI